MSAAVSELAAVAFFVVTGWVALWPARHELGPMPFHGAALPVGLLAGALAAAFSNATHRPLDLVGAAVGALAVIALAQGLIRLFRGASAPAARTVGWRSFAAAGGGGLALAVLLAFAKLTVTNNDSVMSYWPLGVALSRAGQFTVSMIASRGPLIPGVNAIHATFGSDWAYVVYPMLAASLLLFIAGALKAPLAALPRTTRRLVTLGVLGFLAIEPSFLFHAFFVHSHMYSATYLMVALGGLWIAIPPTGDVPDARSAAGPLVLAGLATAGLGLSRPDGLAYMFIPIAIAIALLSGRRAAHVRGRDFFVPLLAVLYLTYASAVSTLGVWQDSKLSGKIALAIVALATLSAFVAPLLRRLDGRLPFRVAGQRFLTIGIAAAGALIVILYIWKWASASRALATTAMNLFLGYGGYGYLWWGLGILFVISLFAGGRRVGAWSRSPLFAIAFFFAAAAIIHGVSHPGRLGVGDSLNRIMFHVVPLMVFYFGIVVAQIIGEKPAEMAHTMTDLAPADDDEVRP